MCSFDGPDLRTNSEVLVSFSVRCRNVCGTFLLYCFDITSIVLPEAIHFTYLPDRWKEVEGGVPPTPPVTHTPCQQLVVIAVDL